MVKFAFRIILFQALMFCFFPEYSSGNELERTSKKALQIVNHNAHLLDSINQLLVVYNETREQKTAMVVAMQKNDGKWKAVFAPMQAGIGRKGFAAPGTKREGDQMSPTGFFRLGQLFCYEKEVDTQMPFIQTTAADKWIDDPDSPDYNQHIRGVTTARTFEKLLLKGNDYRYCMVIEYNTHPVVKGNGSAIFLHLSEFGEINSSSGCIVLLQADMEKLLHWMSPKLNPSVIMGTEKDLTKGLTEVK
jgi:L,D-peptidoglycan transpeptidase YkuD (ErfK/YbiS/YcfS/YnhG family)